MVASVPNLVTTVPVVSASLTPAPKQVVEKLISSLTGPGTGRDWNHFCLGLGTGLKKEENIRLKEGELCNIERKFDDNLGALLRHVVREFERRCRRFDVTVDTTQHIQDVLRTEAILYDQAYYTGLASELGRIRLLN